MADSNYAAAATSSSSGSLPSDVFVAPSIDKEKQPSASERVDSRNWDSNTNPFNKSLKQQPQQGTGQGSFKRSRGGRFYNQRRGSSGSFHQSQQQQGHGQSEGEQQVQALVKGNRGGPSGRSSTGSGRGSGKYSSRRRPPPKTETKPNDVYICAKSNFQSQLDKCKKLLDGEFHEIFIHGLDQAIPRALNIALELKKFYKGTIDYSTTTDTVHLVDDLIPTDDFTAPSYEKRIVSCVDIHVSRTVKIP